MITMNDIAKEAGVSRTTVSFVLNNSKMSRRISASTRKRIEDTATRLRYFPNEIARSMINGKSQTIGFVVSSTIETEYGAKISTGLMKRADERGFFIKLLRLEDDLTLDNLLEFTFGQHLAALILNVPVSTVLANALHTELTAHKIPILFLTGETPDTRGFHIKSDDFNGGRLAFEHLYELGHRNFTLLTECCDSDFAQKRIAGFLHTAASYGVNIPKKQIILQRGFARKAIIRFDWFSAKSTAIFCSSDYLAVLVYTTLLEHGIKVPTNVSLIGYGNSRVASCITPQLTTIQEFHQERAEMSIDLLLDTIDHGAKECFEKSIRKLMHVKLVPGESTVPPGKQTQT